ncbi:hypothetical protein PR048_032640 [Dryococelus australis]|uniref:Uncharacterized protein n=1 Tax=Dryococelus australis TaxID=614101 RepID=A0ABQ9G2S5_9NEOP|nr:hypothetical protein PR048_032640 [Dryococelus australis]
MEQRRNARAGRMGDPRENPPTSGIVHDEPHFRKSGVNSSRIEPGSPWWKRLAKKERADICSLRGWQDDLIKLSKHFPKRKRGDGDVCSFPCTSHLRVQSFSPLHDTPGSLDCVLSGRERPRARAEKCIDVSCVDNNRDYLFLPSATVSLKSRTDANRVQSLAGSSDFRKWESCRTMPLVGEFSRGSPGSSALSFRRRSMLTSITLIGSQDLAHWLSRCVQLGECFSAYHSKNLCVMSTAELIHTARHVRWVEPRKKLPASVYVISRAFWINRLGKPPHRHGGNTARLARSSDEALGVRVTDGKTIPHDQEYAYRHIIVLCNAVVKPLDLAFGRSKNWFSVQPYSSGCPGFPEKNSLQANAGMVPYHGPRSCSSGLEKCSLFREQPIPQCLAPSQRDGLGSVVKLTWRDASTSTGALPDPKGIASEDGAHASAEDVFERMDINVITPSRPSTQHRHSTVVQHLRSTQWPHFSQMATTRTADPPAAGVFTVWSALAQKLLQIPRLAEIPAYQNVLAHPHTSWTPTAGGRRGCDASQVVRPPADRAVRGLPDRREGRGRSSPRTASNQTSPDSTATTSSAGIHSTSVGRACHRDRPAVRITSASARLQHRGSKFDPSSDLRSTQKTVAPFQFRAGLEIEMKFISNRRNWRFGISIRDQRVAQTILVPKQTDPAGYRTQNTCTEAVAGLATGAAARLTITTPV